MRDTWTRSRPGRPHRVKWAARKEMKISFGTEGAGSADRDTIPVGPMHLNGEELSCQILVPLSGSERDAAVGRPVRRTPLDESQTITVTVDAAAHVPRVPAALVTGPETVSTTQLGDQYGAEPDDAPSSRRPARRLRAHRDRHAPGVAPLKVSGTIAAMQRRSAPR